MKILLVNPPADHLIVTELPGHIAGEVGRFPPLGLLYLAASLRRAGRHQVALLDLPVCPQPEAALREQLTSFRPDLVGITAITHNLPDVRQVARTVKSCLPTATTVIGGPHVNAFPAEAPRLEAVDFAIAGEGELSLPLLADQLAQNQSPTGVPGLLLPGDHAPATPPHYETNLDSLPFPARELLRTDDYFYLLGQRALFATIIASRGCPFHCIFCSTPHGGYRMRSPVGVADEMAACLKLGVDEIHFVDDTFNLGRRRLAEISEEILRRRLPVRWSFRGRADGIDREGMALAARAGCVRLHIGVETGTAEGLKLLRKGVSLEQIERAVLLAREFGIVSAAYFIIGGPHERTSEDVLKTIRFAVKLNPDFAMFNVLAIYPGTELFDLAVARGLLRPDLWTDFALDPRPDFRLPLWDEHLDRATLQHLLELSYRRFYLRPSVVWRNLKALRSAGELRRKAEAALSILRGRS